MQAWKLTTILALIFSLGTLVRAQEIRITFDSDQSDYGVYEITGTDTALSLTRSGGIVAANDFAELDGLSSETYFASGAELGTYTPFRIEIETSGGLATTDTSGLDIGGGGIDATESISLIFSHTVLITEFDLANIDTGTFAAVSVGGSILSLGDSTGDVHSGSYQLNAGQALTFSYAESNSADYDIQGLTLQIVPEASCYSLATGLVSLAFASFALRKRR
ncbi:hypothetical protein [Coraliomargarita parva]|uniref:hypothetical protein n=1 Tax=Coraliomargarita parva TaxID=3014050 RepID=UPI0022B59B92|nr:hypothetical protein [Coraliomargarita parva]